MGGVGGRFFIGATERRELSPAGGEILGGILRKRGKVWGNWGGNLRGM